MGGIGRLQAETRLHHHMQHPAVLTALHLCNIRIRQVKRIPKLTFNKMNFWIIQSGGESVLCLPPAALRSHLQRHLQEEGGQAEAHQHHAHLRQPAVLPGLGPHPRLPHHHGRLPWHPEARWDNPPDLCLLPPVCHDHCVC